jgi:hypothetical protein
MSLRKLFSAKFISAFVSVILLVNLLMPSIAAATMKRNQFVAIFNVICISSGLKLIDASGKQSVPAHSQQDAMHCPMCAIGGTPSLPSQPLSFVALFQGLFAFEYLAVYQAPPQTFWFSSSPRGPPTIA